MTQWHYTQNGTQLGPVSEAELKALIQSQQLRSTDLVWNEGMSDWRAISEVGELNSAPAGGPPAVPAGASAQATSPYQSASPYQAPATNPTVANVAEMQQIPNYLWQSILVTLCCCLPLGIVAIVYASKVDGLKAMGDIDGARVASKSARTWVNWSVGVTLIGVVLYFGLALLVGVGGSL